MRFPKLTDLDAEQMRIYSGAPPTGSVIVVGPPGTGKTVMAFHRAAYLEARGKLQPNKAMVPRVLMYSKVLSTYTAGRDGLAPTVATSTLHKWVYEWWRLMFGRKPPPHCADDAYAFNWTSIVTRVLISSGMLQGRQHWGHLIIDEGQDFPPDMYRALSAISSSMVEEGIDARPAITVFADENQRLSETRNSTIQEIETALSLPEGRRYALKRNYRNTLQIAAFVRHFYVGLPSGIPDLPVRVGTAKPKVVLARSGIEVARRRIALYAKNNPDKDVGVICMADSVRRRCFNSLCTRLAGSNIVVQTYSNKEREEHPPEALKFDCGGSVTVLNAQSAKGLEFDSVFVIDPLIDAGGASLQQARMQLYVTASRPRDYLELILMNPPDDYLNLLPESETYDFIEE